MRKTRDYERAFRGLWSEGGVCRVRLYEDPDGDSPPVVVLSELPKNTNTSVTNLVEVLAAEIAEELMVVSSETRFVEHYPRTLSQLGAGIAETFDFVTFSALESPKAGGELAGLVEIGRAVVGGVMRPSFGTPEWRHATRAEVAELLGEDIGDEVLAEPETKPEKGEEDDPVEKVEKAQLGPGEARAREHGMDLSLEWEAPDGDVVLKRIPDFERGLNLRDELQTMLRTNVAWTVVLHSETGFEYGYGGQGPGDLALNILNMFCPPGEDGLPPVECFDGVASRTAWELHQALKREVIAPLDRFADHVLSGAEIRSWIEARRRGSAGEAREAS